MRMSRGVAALEVFLDRTVDSGHVWRSVPLP